MAAGVTSSSIAQRGAVERVVRSAWRRRLLVDALEQLAFALAITFAGAILMLLLGTQILDWYWLVFLALLGAAVGAARIWKRMAGRYEVAQALDTRLQLQDSLSTAWFLLSDEDRCSVPAARYQISHAEVMAATVEPAKAFPFTGHRSWTVTAVIAMLVCGLFGARYLVTNSLSLRPALLHLRFDGIARLLPNSLHRENKENGSRAARNGNDLAARAGERTDASKDLGTSRHAAQASDAASQTSADSGKGVGLPQGDQANEQPGKGDGRNPNVAGTRDPGAPGASQADSNSRWPQDARRQDRNGESSAGLLDKMKDALSSLMAKMRPDSGSKQNSSQNGQTAGQDAKESGRSSGRKDQAGNSQDGQQQGNADTQAEVRAQALTKTPGQGAESDDRARAKGSDPQSGAGRQDGQKDLKEAEEEKAVGRLAEIIGKRSASLTGDMSIDTPSSKQDLKTQYSGKVGRHADTSGEMHRDEIPPEYREYIRQYMIEVHKDAEGK